MNAIKKIIYNYGIPFTGWILKKNNKFINVIYYHDIVHDKGSSFQKTNINTFKKQMKYIANHGYTTLRFDDLNDTTIKYSAKTIIIAFDDGWKSNYTEIYEFMKSLGLKYNVYLAIKEIGVNPDYLTWEQVCQMHNEGIVGFGAHTYTHPDMSDINLIDPQIEFNKTDEIFQERLGYQPLDFCYPFGKYSTNSNSYIIKNTRYTRIYTSQMMYSYTQEGKIIFGRNGISNDDSFNVFKAKLKGYFNIFKTLIG